MLVITPGISTADTRVLDKTPFITWGNDINCDIYRECNMMNPVFLLSYNQSIVSDNYLKVESWGRYYYIQEVTLAPGGRMYFTCAEDVLMSNKDKILALNAYSSRSESSVEHYAIDDKVLSKVTNYVTHITFERGFSSILSNNYLLTVKGGAPRNVT